MNRVLTLLLLTLLLSGPLPPKALPQGVQTASWIEENERGDELDDGLPPARNPQAAPFEQRARPAWEREASKRRRQFWRSIPKPRAEKPARKRAKEYFDPDE
jgi:hypothetical protein